MFHYSEQLEKKQKQYKDLEDFMEEHKKQKASMEADKSEQKRKVSYICTIRLSECNKLYTEGFRNAAEISAMG